MMASDALSQTHKLPESSQDYGVNVVLVAPDAVLRLEPILVGSSDEAFKPKIVCLAAIFKMFFESTASVKVAKLPSFATKNEIGFGLLKVGGIMEAKWPRLQRQNRSAFRLKG